MTLFTPLWLQPATGDADIPYTGQQDRGLFDVLIATPGVAQPNDLFVSQRGAGANMSVDVAAGSCVVQGHSVANQGKYLCQSTSTVNVAITAAPGSGTRKDVIVAQVYDKQSDGGTTYGWTPKVITGLDTIGTIPDFASPSCIPLAIVTVAAGVSSIVTANIADARVQAVPVGTPYIQKGVFTVTFTAGVATGTITFPKPFSSAPQVLLSCQAITNNTATTINDTGVSATGFSYRAAPSAGGSYSGAVTGRYIALL